MIADHFEKVKNTPSDINEHIQTLYEYALKVKHITEFGFRGGNSAIAFLMSNPDKFHSYDIIISPEVETFKQMAENEHFSFIFHNENTLNCEIEPTELLFIDSEHTHDQVLKELQCHAHNVSKYIILHDTETFKDYRSGINEWLSGQDQDWLTGCWNVEKEFTNNNGLLVLRKVG